MKLLLHACCAPCSSAILEKLTKEGIVPTIFYCNPNIYPEAEFDKREKECERYASYCNVPIVTVDYDHDAWLERIKGLENEPERGNRCLECFRMRLECAAAYAAENGFDTLATTLSSSRWKNLEQINLAGEEAVRKAAPDGSLKWLGENWRKGGLQQRRNELIKEMGFYNQTWCGCEFSVK